MSTIKIGDKVTIKNTGKEVVIENIFFCHYYVTGESTPFTASDLIRVKDKPTIKKRKPIQKTTTKINKTAPKRAKQLRAYKVLSEKWHEDNKTCKNCGATGDMELHHQKGKENELLLDTTQWIALCNNCHREATDKSKEAIEKGISISRHKKQ